MAENNNEDCLSSINTFALIDELTKRDPKELQMAIYALLRQKKLNYTELSKLYVQSLEEEKEDSKGKLSEAAACILSHIIHQPQTENHQDINHNKIHEDIQRSLYFLDKIYPIFKIDDLKKKYSYRENEAVILSDYGRYKNNIKS